MAMKSLLIALALAASPAPAAPPAEPTLIVAFLFTVCGQPLMIETVDTHAWHVGTNGGKDFDKLVAAFKVAQKQDPNRLVTVNIGENCKNAKPLPQSKTPLNPDTSTKHSPVSEL